MHSLAGPKTKLNEQLCVPGEFTSYKLQYSKTILDK